jgi:outer membrane lipoprotein-sorting protein
MNKFLRSGGHKLLFAALFVMLVFASQAKAQIINEILKKVDDHRKALTSLKANIQMAKYDPTLKETDKSEGTLLFAAKTQKIKSALVRIDWQSPQQEIMSIVNGDGIIYRPRLNQGIKFKADEKKGGANGPLAFLNMSKEEIKENYSAQYLGEETLSGSAPTWHLKFTPKAVGSKYTAGEIWVDGNGMIIQAKVILKNGDESTVHLSNLQKNTTINTKEFVVNVPKNVTWIKS